MKRRTGEQIMSAVNPSQIFSMNLDTIEQEKDEYLERFKPEEYNTIKNFMVTQKVIQLYRLALEELGSRDTSTGEYGFIELTGTNGERFSSNYHYMYDVGCGEMYVTEDNVVFVIDSKYQKYYRNYIEKTREFPHLSKKIWEKGLILPKNLVK